MGQLVLHLLHVLRSPLSFVICLIRIVAELLEVVGVFVEVVGASSSAVVKFCCGLPRLLRDDTRAEQLHVLQWLA